jgi:hypothetical protein
MKKKSTKKAPRDEKKSSARAKLGNKTRVWRKKRVRRRKRKRRIEGGRASKMGMKARTSQYWSKMW